jgi:hypothetical protein
MGLVSHNECEVVSMAPKFDKLIQRYEILIPGYAAYNRIIMVPRYAT